MGLRAGGETKKKKVADLAGDETPLAAVIQGRSSSKGEKSSIDSKGGYRDAPAPYLV